MASTIFARFTQFVLPRFVKRCSTIVEGVGFKVPKGKGGSGASKSGIDKYVQENVVVVKEKVEPCPWVPDPVTGHYKPMDRIGVTDPAQLREVMLKH